MFWETKDPPSHNIEILLESPDTKVELFLEEDNIIQECKTFKKNIVSYFTRPDVIRRMIELITTDPPEEVPINERFRHANVACEILTMGIPSLDEKLLADRDTLNMLYSYLENEPPLNPLLASFFSKTFSMLFTKKSDQDWFLYQQMCLKLLEYLKSKNNFLDLICRHFTTPIVPDLIMEMMQNVESEVKRNLFEWLDKEGLVEKLISIIGDPEQSEKHAHVADFLCELIHQGRTMRQDVESFEAVFGGSDPILRKIEDEKSLIELFNAILKPSAVESSIVSGITVVLKIIKPAQAIDERNMERMLCFQAREEDFQNVYLRTVICVIKSNIKYLNLLLKNPPKKSDIVTSAATLSPPFGMARLQIVRLFAELLKTENEEICKEICETDFLDCLLALFKQYCWNNFLHREVENCLHSIFPYSSDETNLKLDGKLTKQRKAPASIPSDIQIHVILHCKLGSKLIECWKMNKESESAVKGRRLGFMGHLINIFKHITKCISESEHIGVLIKDHLENDNECKLWQSITDAKDGELAKILSAQSKLLANHKVCEYNEYNDYNNVPIEVFNDDNNGSLMDVFNDMCSLMESSSVDPFYVEPNSYTCDEIDDILDEFCLALTESFQPAPANTKEVASAAEAAAALTAPTQETNALTTSSSEEYDNNANVEKSTSWSGDFTSFQIPKKDTQFTSNFVDDYEDDEGMWTKPLGASTSTLSDPFGQTHEFETNFITNGPSSFEEGDRVPAASSPNQLNNSIEDNTLVGEITKGTQSSENNGELIKEINSEERTSKHKSNTPDTNETETNAENTTTNSPTNQLTNTATVADEITDVSTTATAAATT